MLVQEIVKKMSFMYAAKSLQNQLYTFGNNILLQKSVPVCVRLWPGWLGRVCGGSGVTSWSSDAGEGRQ